MVAVLCYIFTTTIAILKNAGFIRRGLALSALIHNLYKPVIIILKFARSVTVKETFWEYPIKFGENCMIAVLC